MRGWRGWEGTRQWCSGRRPPVCSALSDLRLVAGNESFCRGPCSREAGGGGPRGAWAEGGGVGEELCWHCWRRAGAVGAPRTNTATLALPLESTVTQRLPSTVRQWKCLRDLADTRLLPERLTLLLQSIPDPSGSTRSNNCGKCISRRACR